MLLAIETGNRPVANTDTPRNTVARPPAGNDAG